MFNVIRIALIVHTKMEIALEYSMRKRVFKTMSIFGIFIDHGWGMVHINTFTPM